MMMTSYHKSEGLKSKEFIYVLPYSSESQKSEMDLRGLKSEL